MFILNMHFTSWLFIVAIHVGYSLKENDCKDVLRLANDGKVLSYQNCLPVDSTKKIMGGVDAGLGEFPWTAALLLKGKSLSRELFWCTGSIINRKYILTAAHCLANSVLQSYTMVVRVGEHDLSTIEDCDDYECAPPPVEFLAEKFIIHPGYDLDNKPNIEDIGLVRILGEIRFNDYVYPACLPTTCNILNASFLNEYMTLAGFGARQDEPKTILGTILQKVVLKGVPSEICNHDWSMEVLPSQICVGDSVGKDSCHGDSGGPLMFPSTLDGLPAKYVLVATVSGGQNCNSSGTSQSPGIYTRVASYMPWILSTIEQ